VTGVDSVKYFKNLILFIPHILIVVNYIHTYIYTNKCTYSV
jgi:hypothetical protein